MRAWVLAGLAFLVAGCVGPTDGPGPGHTEPMPEAQHSSEVIAVARLSAATAGDASPVPVHQLPILALRVPFDASQLQFAVDFESSAFTDFTFAGIPACGEGFGPGSGAYPNAARWSSGCGPVAAGSYDLSWQYSGMVQGTLTVTAIP